MPELTLHLGNKNYSSWSLRAWLVLRHSGASFREEVIPLTPEGRTRVRSLSPAGRVPFLRHGELLVWDSLAIAEYVAETFPAARLWPDDARDRAHARSICAEMHSGFTALRANMPMNVRRRSAGKGRAAGVAEDIARIAAIWADCRARHAGEGPLLFGRFTIADAFYAPVATRFTTYGVDLDPVSTAYVEAIRALPAMAEWRAAAESEPWSMEGYDL
ncbi:MAG: glutathione S-transferase family protein [Acidobacteriota bacterium]